jgi:hypothetical protein
MKTTLTLLACVLLAMLTACGKNETPVDSAVEGTKDALDLREHEKLKDAAADMQEAVEGAAEGIRKETGTE